MGLLALLPTLLPFAIDAITGIEKLFGHGHGVDKKTTAVAVVGDGLNIFNTVKGGTQINTSDVQNEINLIIETVVAVLNNLGIFTHAEATK